MASTKPVESAKALKGQLDPLDLFDVRSELSDEERMVQGSVGRFVDDKVIPVIRDAFENHYFPADLVPQIAELGLLGSSISGYDCAGLNSVCYGLICQELERGDSGIRSFVSVQSSLVMFPIHAYGSDEQKDRWLPAMARGEAIGCFGLTTTSRGLLLHHFCASRHRYVAVYVRGRSARVMVERFSVSPHLGVRRYDRRGSARTVAWTIRDRRNQGCLAGYPANDDCTRLVVVGPLPAIGNTYLKKGTEKNAPSPFSTNPLESVARFVCR